MRKVYLSYENIPYLYNINSNKLYELLGKHLKEVVDYRIIRNVRFHSSEISRKEAVLLVKKDDYTRKQHVS
ncbi:MAG: hypothetical protein U9N83_05830 [Thermodesulfobacteriota bacterium]|nr:hypothetical protein [Thermodesulfobacteriota bacterium]